MSAFINNGYHDVEQHDHWSEENEHLQRDYAAPARDLSIPGLPADGYQGAYQIGQRVKGTSAGSSPRGP